MLGDLNDFISPSQACVNPIFAEKDASESAKDAENVDKITPKIQLSMDAPDVLLSAPKSMFREVESTTTTTKKKAQVSLSDCLACSGCVTSAETVLIQAQSLAKLREALASPSARVNVALSTQSLVSLGARLGDASVSRVFRGVRAHLEEKYPGTTVAHLADAAAIALDAAASEFIRVKRKKAVAVPHSWSLPTTSIAVDSSTSRYFHDVYGTQEFTQREADELVVDDVKLPVLTSECPGWVCYVEKTHPEAISYVSRVKSAQQISGAMVRESTDSERVFNCTVMPCADKKLEASRLDFYDGSRDAHDVDCVLTTQEIFDFLTEGNDFSLDDDDEERTDLFEIAFGGSATRGASGGYCDYVFRRAAKELYGVEVDPNDPLPYRKGRNQDVWYVDLEVDGVKKLRFGLCYGFRNIQSLLRQMKRGKCRLDYVEVMACPSGCVNGGGQLKPADDDRVHTQEELRALGGADHERRVLDHLLRIRSKLESETRRADVVVETTPSITTTTSYHSVPQLSDLVQKW